MLSSSDQLSSVRLVASVDPRQRDAAGPVGCLGFVRLTSPLPDGPSDEGAARSALAAGIDWLRSRGTATTRCPVQLSTWYGHRAMTGGFPDGTESSLPAFPLEPVPVPGLPGLLEGSGFSAAHLAVSCLVDSTAVVDGTAALVRRVQRSGIRDRPIRLTHLDSELRLLHRLAEATFEGMWGFSSITFDEFASIYRPLDGRVDRELIRILEAPDGTPIGLALALRIDAGTFVLKTLGVTAEARRAIPGIGAALIGIVHRVAIERGATAGIHALMATGSAGHRISLRWGREFRSYATYELAAP